MNPLNECVRDCLRISMNLKIGHLKPNPVQTKQNLQSDLSLVVIQIEQKVQTKFSLMRDEVTMLVYIRIFCSIGPNRILVQEELCE